MHSRPETIVVRGVYGLHEEYVCIAACLKVGVAKWA